MTIFAAVRFTNTQGLSVRSSSDGALYDASALLLSWVGL